MKPTAIVWLETVDSTNSELRRGLESLDNLSIVAARFQTAGRGQGSHRWTSAAGQNLTFSILLKPGTGGLDAIKANAGILLTQIATLSMRELLLAEGLDPVIKWPNDVWVDGRKVCGMLIENIVEGGYITASIIGIGLNLNQKEFDPLLPNPTSLSLLTGKEYITDEVLEEYAKIFCRYAELTNSESGRARLQSDFSESVFVLDEERQASLNKAIEDYEASKSE